MLSKITAVTYTLNQIEVHGKENLDMLLGCIMTLEQIGKELKVQAVKEPEKEPEKEAIEDG